ncbi:hypothetical protein EV401DRAFT_1143021 [Pisolithus croceorrhizus]|nr:hypothetical protein EV401DRAFT_1143021 [Pisolithus croceorrhizus]
MMVYECLLFSVAFFAALRRYREELGPLSASRGGVTRLTDILIEGNVVCFFITMAYAVSSLVVLLTLPLEWVLGILNLGFSLSVIVGCHLILQIRKALSPTTLVYVIGEDGPAPSYVSMVFPYSSRSFCAVEHIVCNTIPTLDISLSTEYRALARGFFSLSLLARYRIFPST